MMIKLAAGALVLSTLTMVAACCSDVSRLAPPPKLPKMLIAGGYAPVTVDEDVQDAAEFAVKTQAKNEAAEWMLKSVVKVERQIVAGRNYRMELIVTQRGVSHRAEAVVYQALDGHYELTSWK